MPIPVRALGQSGFRLGLPGCVTYVDPYLTDRVARVDGEDLRRLVPPPLSPEEVSDADLVLVTHEHADHFDPDTILPLAAASPDCRLVAPAKVISGMVGLGIARERLTVAVEEPAEIAEGLRIAAVPAAHPSIERDSDGRLRHVGYVLETPSRRLYHSGDTSPDREIAAAVRSFGPIDAAFLPVNERNRYRDRRGIVANMSIREAFLFALEVGARVMVPMHWDLFAPNRAYREEIQLLYELIRPDFRLALEPEEL